MYFCHIGCARFSLFPQKNWVQINLKLFFRLKFGHLMRSASKYLSSGYKMKHVSGMYT